MKFYKKENDSNTNEECENVDNDTDIYSQMKKYGLKNVKKVILAILNIDNIANKCASLRHERFFHFGNGSDNKTSIQWTRSS